jgi:hypothetical protein
MTAAVVARCTKCLRESFIALPTREIAFHIMQKGSPAEGIAAVEFTDFRHVRWQLADQAISIDRLMKAAA